MITIANLLKKIKPAALNLYKFLRRNPGYTYALCCAAALVLIAVLIHSCRDGGRGKTAVEKEKEAIEVLEKQAANINSSIRSLEIEEAAKKGEITVRKGRLIEAQSDRLAAQNETNKSLENVNRAENAATADSTLEEAEKARCRAFPEQCKK